MIQCLMSHSKVILIIMCPPLAVGLVSAIGLLPVVTWPGLGFRLMIKSLLSVSSLGPV